GHRSQDRNQGTRRCPSPQSSSPWAALGCPTRAPPPPRESHLSHRLRKDRLSRRWEDVPGDRELGVLWFHRSSRRTSPGSHRCYSPRTSTESCISDDLLP